MVASLSGARMRDGAILRTLHELDRWRRRHDEVRAAMAADPRVDLRAELEKVERQMSYYQALAEDMKREVRPARTRDLLSLL